MTHGAFHLENPTLLAHHMRNEQHAALHNPRTGEPVVLIVSPWWGAVSQLPAGPKTNLRADEVPQPAPSHHALERVIDHVHDWTGIEYMGRPLACSRSALRSMCLLQPAFYREVMRAIRLASSRGIPR